MDDGGRHSISGLAIAGYGSSVLDISSFSRQDECILQNMMLLLDQLLLDQLSKFLCDVSFHRRN